MEHATDGDLVRTSRPLPANLIGHWATSNLHSVLVLSISVMVRALSSIPRNEFFAGLFILGCVNGLVSRAMSFVNSSGWNDAILHVFGISVIVWIAWVAGVALVAARESEDVVNWPDLFVGGG